MIKVFNWAIPIVGYKAMTVWPFLFIRDDLMVPMKDVDYNHEEIHGRQQIEMLIVGAVIALILFVWGCGWWSMLALPVFFYWYVTEWFIRIFTGKKAYRNISFEQEAFINERDMDYISMRKPFAWVRFLFRTTYK